MKYDMSKLSPQARKAVMVGGKDAAVRAMVELAPGVTPDSLETSVERLGGVVRSWSESSHVMTLSLPSKRLPELANDRDVVYVETSGIWSNPVEPDPGIDSATPGDTPGSYPGETDP